MANPERKARRPARGAALTQRGIRDHCLSLPGATVNVQWGEDHVFKVGGKMFAVIGMMDGQFHGLSFKCAPDSFHILTQLPGIAPAPYLARAQWVALRDLTALPAGDLRAYLTRAHGLIAAKLPRATRKTLGLDLAVASEGLRSLRGKVKLSIDMPRLHEDD